MSSVRWVIVGASGSPGSLQVLRYAQHLARDLEATWCPCLPGCRPMVTWPTGAPPWDELRCLWAQDARQRLQDALNLAWGQPPADLPVRPLVRRGRRSPVLADAACRPGDLLVVGTARRSALARTGGRVSRYCRTHAQCPVLILPPTPLAHEARRAALTRVFWHRTLTTDQISHHKRGAAA